jgi:hypothetical protein
MLLIEKQGQVVRIARLSDTTPLKPASSKRGTIQGFSRKSRRRLIDLMARLDTSATRKTFLTLTFQGKPSPDEARAAFKRFTMRLRRSHPDVSGVWRVELQERGSAHYHMMLFALPYIPQRELQDIWTACTREDRSIVNVQLIRSHRGVMKYVSKYIAKASKTVSSTSLDNVPYQHGVSEAFEGRQWGYINKSSLPMAARSIGMIVDEELAHYFWWCCGAQARGRRKTECHSTRWYTGDAQAIFDYALNVGGFELSREEARNVMQRQKNQHARIKTSWFFAGIGTHL